MQALFESDIADWEAVIDPPQRRQLIDALEAGGILYFPHLRFDIFESEKKFLSPRWLDGSRKNISWYHDSLGGATGSVAEQRELAVMLERFAVQATELVAHLGPRYAAELQRARTSFRPADAAGRQRSWRQDDSRLHVDAFPSRPSNGERILRVFSNLNPNGAARVWRTGEPFCNAARRYLPRIKRPLPGVPALLNAFGITKGRRSEYDHIMLQLHDSLKADLAYQSDSEQLEVAFVSGSTWMCFSDQVLHAVKGGQYLIEQTLQLPIDAQYHPELSPLKTLERLRGRNLA